MVLDTKTMNIKNNKVATMLILKKLYRSLSMPTLNSLE